MRTVLATLLAALLLSPAWAAAACHHDTVADPDARQLYAAGAKMSVRVLGPKDSEFVPGLTAQVLADFVEVRLDSVGLHSASATQHLYLTVQVAEADYLILMILRREAADLGYGVPGTMSVWFGSNAGQHGGSMGGILAQVGFRLNEFVEKYKAAQRQCAEEM